MIAWKGGNIFCFPDPQNLQPLTVMQYLDTIDMAEKGVGSKGRGGGPRELGRLFIILQIISPSWPKIAQIILSVHLSFARSLCHCYFARAAVPSVGGLLLKLLCSCLLSDPLFCRWNRPGRLSSGSAWEASSSGHLTLCWPTVSDCNGAADSQAIKGSPAGRPAPPPMLLGTLGSSFKNASRSPKSLPVLGCDKERLWVTERPAFGEMCWDTAGDSVSCQPHMFSTFWVFSYFSSK